MPSLKRHTKRHTPPTDTPINPYGSHRKNLARKLIRANNVSRLCIIGFTEIDDEAKALLRWQQAAGSHLGLRQFV